MRNKYRLKFEKIGPVAYLGHLDLLKLFQRSIARAKIPIAFSNGFNPHQLMSFGLPIPLGMEAYGEYLDIELKNEVDVELLIANLNESLPDGISIIKVYPFAEAEKSAAAIVIKASYSVIIPFQSRLKANLSIYIKKILGSTELRVNKRTKSGIKEVDIREDILDIKDLSSDNEISLEMILSAGSSRNLKPEVVTQLIFEYADLEYNQYSIKFIRKELILENE